LLAIADNGKAGKANTPRVFAILFRASLLEIEFLLIAVVFVKLILNFLLCFHYFNEK